MFKIKSITKFFFSFFVIVLFSHAAIAQNDANSSIDKNIEKGRIRIKIKEKYLLNDISSQALNVGNTTTKTVGVTSIDRIGDNIGITRIKRVFPFSLKNEAKHRKYGLHQWFEVEFSESINPETIVEQYKALVEVDLAKPVFKKVRIDAYEDPKKFIPKKLSSKSKSVSSNGKRDLGTPLLYNQSYNAKDGSLGTVGMNIELFKAWKKETDTSGVNVDGFDVERKNQKKLILGKLSSTNEEPNYTNKSSTSKSASSKEESDFDDPLLDNQWHYENDGSLGTVGMDIELFKAWKQETGSSDVIVAIVDGGIDVEHEDLRDNVWVNEAEVNGEDGVDDDQNGYIDDYYGANFVFPGAVTPHSHGTHVAGTVGAVNNNGIGVAGVAGGDGSGNGVRLMSCQVFDNRTSYSGNFAAAIVYGADNGAVISQNSWGYTIPDYYEPEVLDAVRYFKAEAGQYEGSPMKGGLLFFAAGNDGLEQTHYPASFEEVVAVTALGSDGYPAPYTNIGEWTDIAAPGGNQSFFGEEGGVLSTLPGNSYGYFQGTSMSCPHVSGVAALAVSKFGGEDFTSEDLDFIIRNSTSRFIFDHQEKYGRGMLNATFALADDEKIAPESITDLRALDVLHNGVNIGWTVPVDEDNFQPTTFYLAVSGSEITADNFDSAMLFAFDNPFDAGVGVSVLISGLNKKTDYWFAMKSADMFNNLSEISNIHTVTTTDEPHFMESSRYVDLEIDVTNNPIVTEDLSFSNIGEGIIYWENYVENEKYYYDVQSKLTNKIKDKAANSTVTAIDMLTNSTNISTASKSVIQSKMTSKQSGTPPEFWGNDTTEFVAGMSYENGSSPQRLLGSINQNTSYIHATRFFVEPDYTFNLTHIEAALYPNINEKPIIVEIKKGSTKLEDAKTVYLQEYYPDTINVLKYYRIPLYYPQRIEDGDTYWIVMHHPEEDVTPLGVLYGDFIPKHFMASYDNGNTFVDYQYYWNVPYIPAIRALSTGDDGSYVFLNPGSGKIEAGESNDVQINIDANALTNGKHLASLAIVTNDIHKPIVNIEVKVNVSGQKPELDMTAVHRFDVFKNRMHELELDLENIGLANLDVYKVKSSNADISNIMTDTLIIRAGFDSKIPFGFQTSTFGMTDLILDLETNVGDISVPVTMLVKEPATIDLSLDPNQITMNVDEQNTVQLTIQNTSVNTLLEYDFDHYNIINKSKGVFAESLDYEVKTSDDIGSEINPNQWDDISKIGFHSDGGSMWKDTLNMNMDFPFFNKIVDKNWGHISGSVYFNSGGWYGAQLPDYDRKVGKGVLAPILFEELNARVENFYFYSYGDRAIYSFELSVDTTYSPIKVDGKIIYQIVAFRDGTVEFRYQNVDNIPTEVEYIVALQGITPETFVTYRNLDETTKKVHNGMVIRFEPSNDISMVVEASPNKGVIPVGGSVVVDLTIDPEAFGMLAGKYKNYVVVNANTEVSLEKIPLSIELLGTPNFVVADTLNFDRTNIGFTNIKDLRVLNKGYDKGLITDIVFNSTDFSITTPLPIQVSADSHYLLPVAFSPTANQSFEETMTISYSNGTSDVVVLSAEGKLDPSYVIDISTDINVNLNGGETVKIPFSVTNSDNGEPLEYTFVNGTFAKAISSDIKLAEGVNNEKVTEKYGYTWAVSDSLKKTFHKWEDIKEIGEVLQIRQNEQQGIELPFEFPFYGELHDSIWVSKNGYITVKKPTADTFSLSFEKDDGVRGMIAPFWSALDPPTAQDGVLMLLENDRLLLQWDGFIGEESNMSGGSLTFQVEIKSDGSIYFHYKNISRWGGLLQYGLESPDETEVFETEKSWILDWSIFTDLTTVAIAPPLKHKVLSGATNDFNVLISAESVYHPGTLLDTITLKTNSKAQPEFLIPVVLNVTGGAKIIGPEILNWEEVIYSNNTILSREIVLGNNGYDLLKISNIGFDNLDGLTLYDNEGNKIVKNSSGTLANAIEILPWNEVKIIIEIPVDEQFDVDGTINFNGSFDSLVTSISAKLVDSPIFEWNAVDQDFILNNSEKGTYTFNIENKGETTLKYNLVPAVIPSGGIDKDSIIVKEVGNYSFEKLLVVDSLAVDSKDFADGIFTPLAGGTILAFSNQFHAPEGGFFLTHVRAFTHLRKVGENVRIMIYVGGESPEDGKKIYQEDFVVDEIVESQWINFPLKVPITIPEGQNFHIVYLPPLDFKFIGYDITSDDKLLEETHVGVYWAAGEFKWYSVKSQGENYVYKIRALTAAGSAQWIQLDHLQGEVEGEMSNVATLIVDAALAGPGEHQAKVFVTSNDVNYSKDEFLVNLNINGAPIIDYRPNQNLDTLKVRELEELTVNYKVKDTEDDTLTFEFFNLEIEPEVMFTQIDNTTAQFTISTNYESAGVYEWEVTISDTAGNVTTDKIIVEVLDKNRPPVLNPEYETIYLNLAEENSVFVIDPNDLFSDPDGDTLEILAGNYTPDIVDLALGFNFIDIHPLKEGTGYLVFAADDGKEDGFVIYGVYVIVINDPDAVGGAPDGVGGIGRDDIDVDGIVAIPNPVVDGTANLYFNLDENAQVTLEIIDIYGRQIVFKDIINAKEGTNVQQVNVSNLPSGVLICTYRVNGKIVATTKLIKI